MHTSDATSYLSKVILCTEHHSRHVSDKRIPPPLRPLSRFWNCRCKFIESWAPARSVRTASDPVFGPSPRALGCPISHLSHLHLPIRVARTAVTPLSESLVCRRLRRASFYGSRPPLFLPTLLHEKPAATNLPRKVPLFFCSLFFFFHPRSPNAIFHSSHLGTRTYNKSSNSSGGPLTLIHLEMAGHSSAWRHAVAFGSDWQFNPQSRISNVPFTFISMPASVASPPFPFLNPPSSELGPCKLSVNWALLLAPWSQ